MVAVKTLWVLWKNFSTNFSISNVINNNQNSTGNGNRNDDRKRVRYNRLKAHHSNSSSNSLVGGFHGSKRDPSVGSFQSAASDNSSGSGGGKMVPSCSTSSGVSSGAPTISHSSSYDSNGNHLGWKCTLDDSDTEYEDDDDHFGRGKNNRITISDVEDTSDFEDEDEGLTCDVCDRSFPTMRKLADHQQKKRHFGCLQCDSIFPSRQALEHHREQMDHYDFVSDYNSDTTSFESDEEGLDDEEERERLL